MEDKVGDNGFDLKETEESENYNHYSTYRLLINDCGFSHSNALRIVGRDEEWYKKMALQYEVELKEDE
jgi:hypothetical protein